MAKVEHQGALGAVYGAESAEQIAALYDGWAADYEADMARAGYRHPAIATALLARHLPRGAGPVLDAGAGTGLLGQWLGILGYSEVDALDISEGMLKAAAAKGVYRALHRLALGQTLPFEDAAYAGIVAAGVFTTGHVGAEALPELIRIVRPGGILVLTVKLALWQAAIAPALAAEIAAGRLALVETTDSYVSMPGEAGTAPSLAAVLRKA